MVEKVENVLYKTSDGKRFKSQHAAEAHEASGRFEALIGPFMASREWKRGRDTLARNILVQFLLHREKAQAA